MFHILFEKVNKFYENVFRLYGKFLAKYYVIIIVGSFTLNFLLSLGVLKFKSITDTDTLFMPVDSKAMRDEVTIKRLFNKNTQLSENFYIHQLADFGTWAEINFKLCSGGNILKPNYLKEIKQINDLILNKTIVKINDSQSIIFNDVCAKINGHCVIDGFDLLDETFYVSWLKDAMQKKKNLELERQSMPEDEENDKSDINEFRFYIKSSVEKPSLTDLSYNLGKDFRVNFFNESLNGTVPAYARLVKLRYNLNSDFVNASQEVKLWELELLKTIDNLIQSENSLNKKSAACDLNKNSLLKSFKITYGVSQSLDIEMNANMVLDSKLITGTFILIMIFATLFMSLNSTCITSPGMLLPAAGIMAATFGMSSAFGILSLFGYEACNLAFVIPFLVYGIGIDDMFIIYASYLSVSKAKDKKEDKQESEISYLISQTLSKSGVSITITSLTDFIAFIIGVSTGFRSVQIFCVYAAVSIAFCYLYQITFFSGFLCLHIKRIEKKKNSILFCIDQKYLNCCKKKNKENEENHLEQNENLVNQENVSSIKKSKSKLSLYKKLLLVLRRMFRFLIKTKYGKLITLIIYVIYLSFSIWKATQIREGLNLSDLVHEESYYNAYIKDNQELTDLSPMVMLVIYEPIDYDKTDTRIRINKLFNEALKIEGISKSFSLNWLNSFGERKINYKKNTDFLVSTLKGIQIMQNDVIIKKTNSGEYEIASSRFYLRYTKVEFNSKDAIPMNKLHELCEESGLPIFPYSLAFKFYEQFQETLPNIIQTFIISVEAMYLISLVFIPDLISVFCIITTMGSIMIGLVGFMHVWGLSLSSITMVELIMSIGFCIDFSAHITHSFIASSGKGSRNKRALKSVMHIGLPIFNSAFSTILGVCLLAFCKSYVFLSFYKTMIIIMSLGVLHALLFLPVLLSLVGPNWPRHKEEQNKKLNQEKELNEIKTLIQPIKQSD